MSHPFHNANDALRFLQGKTKDSTVGRVILASDVDEALEMVDQHKLEQAVAPRPRTMAQAKRLVRQDEELMKLFEYDRTHDRELGSSVQAGPDPSSRT